MITLASAASSHDLGVFGDIVVVLTAAGLVALVMQRLRLATIPAYLIAGMLLGPGALQIIHSPEQVERVADLAVILLMFGIGLHMDLNAVSRGLGRLMLGTVLVSGLSALLLLPLGLWWGLSVPSALTAALGLTLSSTVVVLRILQERRELHTTSGRISIAVLVMQDMLAIVLLLLLPVFAKWNGGGESLGRLVSIKGAEGWISNHLLDALADGALAIGVVALIIVVGRLLLPKLMLEAARSRSSEILMVISMAAAMLAAAMTQLVGLNTALGAFLAGFLLASTPFRHQLGGQVTAIRDVFGAIFFTAVGMGVPVMVVVNHAPSVLIGVAAILLVKSFVIALVCWAIGTTGNTAIRVGLALAQAGEFTIVLLSVAATGPVGLLNDDHSSILIAIVVISIMVTPWLIQFAAWLNHRLPPISTAKWNRVSPLEDHPTDQLNTAAEDTAQHTTPAKRRRAIVAGYGLVGRAVADELKRMGFDVLIIEMNTKTVKRQSSLGRKVIFGDVSNPDVLENAGIYDADTLVLTIPDEESVMRACRAARELNPGIFIVARMSYVSQGIAAAGGGANGVVVEEMATAEAMERLLKKALGTA